jgi:hypothetical protein
VHEHPALEPVKELDVLGIRIHLHGPALHLLVLDRLLQADDGGVEA